MASIKHQYHRKEQEWHSPADITIHLKRPSTKKMDAWTPEEKSGLKEFISMAEESFKDFIAELKQQLL